MFVIGDQTAQKLHFYNDELEEIKEWSLSYILRDVLKVNALICTTEGGSSIVRVYDSAQVEVDRHTLWSSSIMLAKGERGVGGVILGSQYMRIFNDEWINTQSPVLPYVVRGHDFYNDMHIIHTHTPSRIVIIGRDMRIVKEIGVSVAGYDMCVFQGMIALLNSVPSALVLLTIEGVEINRLNLGYTARGLTYMEG